MRSYLAYITLRFGLAFVFASTGIASLISPEDWVQYVPSIITSFMSAYTFVILFAIYQLILPLVLIFRKNVTWPAVLAALTLFFTAFSNLSNYDIVFRDFGLALAALSLMFLGKIRS